MLKRRQDGPPKFPIFFKKRPKILALTVFGPRCLLEASQMPPRPSQEPPRATQEPPKRRPRALKRTCVRCQVSSMRCAQLRGCLVCKYQRESQTGVRCQASGVQCQVPGVKCQVPGARCQVSGVRCQVSGVRCQVPKRFETECWQSNCNFPVIHRTVYGLRASYMTC